MHTHQEFLEIKQDLTEQLAGAIEKTLIDMGEDVKGISWFSSIAKEYNYAKNISC